jgi:hypothetical protein
MDLIALVSPGLSLPAQAFIRTCYGILLFALLFMTLPQSKRFFVSERFGGYAKSSPWIDKIQNPTILPLIIALWFACAVALAGGFYTVLAGFVNFILCRYFFIQMRWKGILRGMGAPGFMAYWLGACVLFLEYGLHLDPSGKVREFAILVFGIDFAFIMLSAGFYKIISGYQTNEGMEYGMVNPWWSYWWRYFKQLPPTHVVFRLLNHAAYATEVAGGVLMIFPATRSVGAWFIILGFFFIATQIRLGFLCEMVIVSALIFMQPGSFADRFFAALFAEPEIKTAAISLPLDSVNTVIVCMLAGYLFFLPLAHAGLWYNFLWRKAFPAGLQKLLELYTNCFGIIIWRVFTIDVINFFANIYIVDVKTEARRLYSRFGALDWNSRFRYCHVGEFVCLASVFTTLKYYPSNRGLFEERLMRYARTVPCPIGSVLLFEYTNIQKLHHGFEFVPAVEYVVDVHRGTVEERLMTPDFSVHVEASPVHEARYPGTYVSLGSGNRSDASH